MVQGSPLTSKNILITGGTGSFGSYILKELSRIPKIRKIVIFSRDEDKQHTLKLKYRDFPHIMFEIGDIRDLDRVREVCKDVDIIFHAAALKQVPNTEANPHEAVLTNIIGAKNISTAAIENNVHKVIGISTDKAVKPVNAMGMTKALQEKIFTAESLNRGETKFACVRYGNVIGSRGSVIPFYKEKIEKGEILPVTHPEMTRFLLTLRDAIDLVFFAAAHIKGGEIFIKKSPSSKITMLAEAMYEILDSKHKNNGSPYFISGIRAGEKLHEILISEDEARNRAEDRIGYYILHPFWKAPDFPGIKEYSSNPATIKKATELRDLLLKADNISWSPIIRAQHA